MSASQRRKGHDWEREVARLFRERLGVEARRGLQSRDGGREHADVIVPGYHVECKCGARPDVWAALDQAERDAKPGLWSVAVVKRDRTPPIAAMRFAVWLELMRQNLVEEETR